MLDFIPLCLKKVHTAALLSGRPAGYRNQGAYSSRAWNEAVIHLCSTAFWSSLQSTLVPVRGGRSLHLPRQQAITDLYNSL